LQALREFILFEQQNFEKSENAQNARVVHDDGRLGINNADGSIEKMTSAKTLMMAAGNDRSASPRLHPDNQREGNNGNNNNNNNDDDGDENAIRQSQQQQKLSRLCLYNASVAADNFKARAQNEKIEKELNKLLIDNKGCCLKKNDFSFLALSIEISNTQDAILFFKTKADEIFEALSPRVKNKLVDKFGMRRKRDDDDNQFGSSSFATRKDVDDDDGGNGLS
jgi:hypothetical protein